MYNDDLTKFVNSQYKALHKMLKYEWRKMETSEFDEDIFHDTLLKCMDKFNNVDKFDENEFKAYITSAFKMNVIRTPTVTLKKEVTIDGSNISIGF